VSSCRLNRMRLDRELAYRGWSASDLAREAGVSEQTLVAARKGNPVTASTLRKIAIALTSAPVIPTAELLLALDEA
jgi:DNA-binding Xre family transcriptional regulator